MNCASALKDVDLPSPTEKIFPNGPRLKGLKNDRQTPLLIGAEFSSERLTRNYLYGDLFNATRVEYIRLRKFVNAIYSDSVLKNWLAAIHVSPSDSFGMAK